MTTLTIRRLAAALSCAVLIAGCGKRQPRAQPGPDVLYERGMTAFQAGRHSRAIQALETFLQSHVGDPRAPRARLTLGRARMAREDHINAAADFTRLLNDFPQDTLARHARFGLCEAYRELSPKPPLDQQYTTAAIAHCESFAGIFPGTPEAGRATGWVGDLRLRLAQKSYDTGMFYFKRGAYDAGVIYFNELLEQFPDSPLAPAALLRLVESYERIGYKEEAEETRARLLRDHPQSTEARSLQQPAAETTGATPP